MLEKQKSERGPKKNKNATLPHKEKTVGFTARNELKDAVPDAVVDFVSEANRVVKETVFWF